MQMQMYYIYMYTGPVITNQVMSPNKMWTECKLFGKTCLPIVIMAGQPVPP